MISASLEDVSVSFPVYSASTRSLKKRLMSASTGGRIGEDSQHRVIVEALSKVSFELHQGDRVALVGHNGAGKTTLLRVLAGIYTPNAGRVRVQGRVAPLFDTGFGMDIEATGLENIRLRALYLGFTNAQIEERIEEIAEFTELGSFLNMPMRTYSAGMQTRLAFAVSTSIEAEVLLLDEQIATGDKNFMDKAERRFEELIERSGIMVLASHSSSAVDRFCNKAILLEHGRVLAFGTAAEVMQAYAARR